VRAVILTCVRIPSFLFLLSIVVVGCVDGPIPIAPLGGGPPTSSLAALGVFVAPVAAQMPSAGVVPYDVVAPLYSDEALKRRFLWLPQGTRIHVDGERLELPVGAVLVKSFSFPIDARDPSLGERLVETRFLVRTADGLIASTYLWNDAQTDAIASGGQRDVPVQWIDAEGRAHDQVFHVPGTSRCQDCHAQRALGITTRQLDVAGTWDDGTTSQLDHFVALGLLDGEPTRGAALVDPYGTASIDARARAYLDTNCGICHAPAAPAVSTGLFWDLAHTSDDALPRCRPTSSVDGRNRVIVPGHPDASAMIARMRSADPFVRMPRGPSRLPDARGIALLDAWITGMTGGPCP
jgi:uncharacterized repeat protein (TIGR03806 family)